MSFIRDIYRCEQSSWRLFARRKLTELRHMGDARKRGHADIFVISFPKSGRTWHRVLLSEYAKALGGQCGNVAAVARPAAGDIGARVAYSHNGATFEDGLPADHPAVADPSLWRGKKVIFLVREPKDVMVSAWFHAHYRTHRYSGSLQEFVRSPLTGIAKLVAARNRWWENRGEAADCLFLSYEQMHADAGAALSETLAFIGQSPIEPAAVEQAVEQSSFARMQRAEAASSGNRGAANGDGEAVATAAFKAREGKVGGYSRHLSVSDIAYIDQAVAHIADPLSALYPRAPC